MSLSLICAGLGRTGTVSLKRAIEILGCGPCFHPVDNTRSSLERLLSRLSTEPVDWDDVYEGYRAAADYPAYMVYRDLVARYPAAKVILTTRDTDRWFDSLVDLRRLGEGVIPTPHESGLFQKALSGFFGPHIAAFVELRDRESTVAAYRAHNAEVKELVGADRLLVFDVTQGWGPLCEFLGVPVPNAPFPHANSVKEYPLLLRRWVSTLQAP